MSSTKQLIRVKEVAELLGFGVSTIWRKVKEDPSFPRPHKISERITVWQLSEILNWINVQCSNSKEDSNGTI